MPTDWNRHYRPVPGKSPEGWRAWEEEGVFGFGASGYEELEQAGMEWFGVRGRREAEMV